MNVWCGGTLAGCGTHADDLVGGHAEDPAAHRELQQHRQPEHGLHALHRAAAAKSNFVKKKQNQSNIEFRNKPKITIF